MRYTDHNTAEDVKIAYIGGGSQGWAWGLMSDLANAGDLSGEVRLYDTNAEAAKFNEEIGNKYNDLPECRSKWNYVAVGSLKEALTGADFVVISILPGTFDEMESDVHTPEKYGIYQSVGDTNGPGGIIRALRNSPMLEVIAAAIRDYAPEAWVINYSNPMTLSVKALYDTFPEIKAFGCCHEVFGTKRLLTYVLKEVCGIDNVERDDVKVNVVGVNHFTWVTKATYRNMDLYPAYREFVDRYWATGYGEKIDITWDTAPNADLRRVKMDLFRRYGVIAAAGDRHLAEFCPGDWYLRDPELTHSWGFGLTEVSWRKDRLRKRMEKSAQIRSGEVPVAIRQTGEDGVKQMRALLGLGELVTNVNMPNHGQIPNLPEGVVVETNAVFRDNMVTPVAAGPLPKPIYPLVAKIVGQQELIAEATRERDLEKAFAAFANDPLVRLSTADARRLFDEMVENTKAYLTEYFK